MRTKATTSRSRTASKAARFAGEVRALGRAAGTFAADMADAEAPGALVAAVERELGPVQILIANAGINDPLEQDPRKIDAAAWDRAMAINLRAPFLLARAAIGGMIERSVGLSANAIAEQAGAGSNPTPKLLRELEAAGQVRRSGSRRSTVWRLISDEERIAEPRGRARAPREHPQPAAPEGTGLVASPIKNLTVRPATRAFYAVRRGGPATFTTGSHASGTRHLSQTRAKPPRAA